MPQWLLVEATMIVASGEAAEEYMDDRWGGNLESGILVKKSLDETETRIGDE